MKEAENNTGDLKNDENDASDEDEDLENSNDTVCSICNCYGEITPRKEIG